MTTVYCNNNFNIILPSSLGLPSGLSLRQVSRQNPLGTSVPRQRPHAPYAPYISSYHTHHDNNDG